MKKVEKVKAVPTPYFLNTDEKFIRKGGRKAPVITMEEFKNVLNLKYIKECKKDYIPEHYEVAKLISSPAETLLEGVVGVLMDTVSKDYDKIAFDNENISISVSYVNMKGTELNGLQITSTGIPYVGYYCGGDGGSPLYLIIYWDGKKLRGYIPIAGNTVNADNTAFGCDYGDDLSSVDLLNGGPTTDEEFNSIYENIGFDFDWIARDIESRIVPSGLIAKAETTISPIIAKVEELTKSPMFIFAVNKLFDQTVISINTTEHWNKKHCLKDGYTANERLYLEPILEKYCLAELAESMYVSKNQKIMPDWRVLLDAEDNISYDKDFEAFMRQV